MKFLSALVAAAATVSALTIDLTSDSAAKPDSKALNLKKVYLDFPRYTQASYALARQWNTSPHKFCATNGFSVTDRYAKFVEAYLDKTRRLDSMRFLFETMDFGSSEDVMVYVNRKHVGNLPVSTGCNWAEFKFPEPIYGYRIAFVLPNRQLLDIQGFCGL